ncbi:MAG: hypothetical protein A2096_17315 [Spirochaetes bacterium GWF1_41_5]|nr:MAG: hypothetical protein A2096_17315 [Spirochaetes bacterium GWF1_41_5]HBE00956.1 hypothetical protein [Spirochaetia bacterium]
MPAIKTAISIDEDIYHHVEEMSQKYQLPKSQIFSQAIEYLYNKDESIELINKINRSLKDINLPEDGMPIKQSLKLFKKIIKDKW